MNPQSWEVFVNGAEFAAALSIVAKAGDEVRSAQAMLTFGGDRLVIRLAGNTAEVSASGVGPGEVRLAGGALEKLAKTVPDLDPLPLRVQGNRLWVARFATPCLWLTQINPTPVAEMIPPDADTFETLLIPFRCSAEEIDAAGAGPLIAKASACLSQVCEAVAETLKNYRVSPRRIEELCIQHIEFGARDFRLSDVNAIRQVSEAWKILASFGVEPHEIKALMDDSLRNAWAPPSK